MAKTFPDFRYRYWYPEQNRPWVREHPDPPFDVYDPVSTRAVPYGPYYARPFPDAERSYYGNSLVAGNSVNNQCNATNGFSPHVASDGRVTCKNDLGQWGCYNTNFAWC